MARGNLPHSNTVYIVTPEKQMSDKIKKREKREGGGRKKEEVRSLKGGPCEVWAMRSRAGGGCGRVALVLWMTMNLDSLIYVNKKAATHNHNMLTCMEKL